MKIYSIITESWSWPWWGVMVSLNVISTLIFIYLSIRNFKANKKRLTDSKYHKTLFIFGAIYVFVALYRSMFVSSYPSCLAWFDVMANTMVVIRSIAFFAEISFAFIISLVLQHMNKELALPSYINNKPLLKK